MASVFPFPLPSCSLRPRPPQIPCLRRLQSRNFRNPRRGLSLNVRRASIWCKALSDPFRNGRWCPDPPLPPVLVEHIQPFPKSFLCLRVPLNPTLVQQRIRALTDPIALGCFRKCSVVSWQPPAGQSRGSTFGSFRKLSGVSPPFHPPPDLYLSLFSPAQAECVRLFPSGAGPGARNRGGGD